MKRFAKGLIVGKFCPLHLGHEYLISTALNHCEKLWIISYTRPEFAGLGPGMRQVWLTERFPQAQVLTFDQHGLNQLCQSQDLASREIPENSAADHLHRVFVAWLCIHVLKTTVDAVFTSESYGPGFGEVLSEHFTQQEERPIQVTHVSVDERRKQWPIRGTQLRQASKLKQDEVNSAVWADMQPRIAILGGESSGKTSLAQELAQYLNCNWVPEYGRTLWEQRQGHLHPDDMLLIAQEQIRQERALAQSGKWLICDTTPLVTEFYSQEMFGKTDPWLKVLSQREYAHIFLCLGDFDFVQDGTRRDALFSQYQQDWYITQLRNRNISFILLSGDLQARLQTVINTIQWDV